MTARHPLRRSIIWLGCWVLSACSTLSVPSPSGPVAAPAHWSGRWALNIDQTQHWSANFDLSGSADAGQLRLSSVFGQTLGEVVWAPGLATLQRPGQPVTHYPSLEALTEALAGAAIPVPALMAWLQGEARPADGWIPDLSQRAQGRLSAMRHQPLPTVSLRLVLNPNP